MKLFFFSKYLSFHKFVWNGILTEYLDGCFGRFSIAIFSKECSRHDESLLNHTTYVARRDLHHECWSVFCTLLKTYWYFEDIETAKRNQLHLFNEWDWTQYISKNVLALSAYCRQGSCRKWKNIDIQIHTWASLGRRWKSTGSTVGSRKLINLHNRTPSRKIRAKSLISESLLLIRWSGGMIWHFVSQAALSRHNSSDKAIVKIIENN